MNFPTFTVLMVEDFAADRELYRRALCRSSTFVYDLVEAESVAAGLALCQTRSIDAILLDYQLPDGNGLDFLERLSAQTDGSNPPVVLITGCGDEKIAVRAIKKGAEDYLVKSDLTPDLLRSTIHSAIENTRLRLQLRQQEDRFRASVENMLDCFGIYSAIRDDAGQIVDFRFEYLNAAAMQSNRMTAADIGKTVCQVFPAASGTGLLSEYAQVVETGIPLVKDDLVYSDVYGGEQLTIAYNVQIGKLDDGIMASWRDITAQKQVELSLQAANRQMATIWESMTDAYVTLDRDWRFTYANSTAIQVIDKLLESPTEEVMGEIYWEVFPWTVGTIIEQEFRRAVADSPEEGLRQRVAVHFEVFYEPSETWFEIHAYPSDEGLGIYFRDINERKRSEIDRISAERERDRFFELSIDLLIVANFEGYFIRVNPACEQILGFTSAELMAQPFLDFVHPDDRAATAAVTESTIAGNVLVNFENRYRCKDGSYRWILWSAMPDVERSLIYADGHDITDLKQAQLNDRFLYELTQRLRRLSDPESIQWETFKSLGEYLDVDRAMWFAVDEAQELATIDRDWYREGLTSHAGVYAIADFILPELQAAQSAGSLAAISDVTTDPFTAPHADTYEQLSIGAFISVPCIEEGRWVATLSVNTIVARSWRDDEIELMQAVVTQLWSLVVQARGVQALRAQEQQTRAARAVVQQQLVEIETIYQTAPVGLCFIDTDLRFVRLNERLAQINGLPVGAHIGRTLREVLPTADILEPLYRQVIESGEPILDLELSGSDPTQPEVTVCCLVSYYPQKDAQGRVVGVNVMVQDISARKRQEVQLQQAEATIRAQLSEIETIYQMAPVGLCFVDTNMQFVRINEQLAQINGLPVAAHTGCNILDVVPDMAEQLIPLYRHVIESGEPILNLEVSGTVPSQPDVVRHWVLCYHPQKDAEDRVVGVNMVVQEITDRKRQEVQLQQAEATIRQQFGEIEAIYQTAPVGLSFIDTNLQFVRINEQLAQINGLPVAEHIGRTIREILPEIADTIEPLYRQVIDSGEPIFDVEVSGTTPAQPGVERHWIASYYPQTDVSGRAIGVNTMVQEITDRKQAEQRLQESEQRLRTGVELAGVGLARFDYATDLVELSPQAAALYGFAPDISMITRAQIHATFHPDERAELEAVIAQVLDPQGQGLFAQDHRAVWPNGEVRCLSVRKQVFFDRSGAVTRPCYAILAAIDVTDRNRNQAALEERNRELDSFVYVVSHDLKAPLRAVTNLSQWIEDDLAGQLTANTQVQMNLLRSRVDRMAATIDGLLEYARIGRSEDKIEPVALSGLLADVIDSVVPLPTFAIDLPTDLPTLSTKRMPLFQVFANLIGNAIKHHHSEAGTIQISVEERGNFYEFAIVDDGPGIAPENQERMFKIFQAVNPQNRSDSTGIGLAIVKKIIEAEGGTIRLESELGKGTTFYFTWPKR
jgi:PAS domain S-box-containing protein